MHRADHPKDSGVSWILTAITSFYFLRVDRTVADTIFVLEEVPVIIDRVPWKLRDE